MAAKIIYVGAQKGGIGKTATIYNLSGALAQLGYKVLCIDLDGSCNLSTTLGYVQNNNDDTICDALSRVCSGRPYDPHNLVHSSDVGIDYVPSSGLLSTYVAQIEASPDKYNTLGKLFEPLREDYDYIFLDNSAPNDTIKRNILCMSEYAVVIVESGAYSLDGMVDTAERIEAIRKDAGRIKTLGILHNKATNTKISKQVTEAVADMYGDLIFNTIIPYRSAMIEQSITEQKPCVSIKGNTLAPFYTALAQEVINRIKGE